MTARDVLALPPDRRCKTLASQVFLLVPLAFALGPSGARGQVSPAEFPHGPLPEGIGCADCHSTQGWSPLDPNRSFDHGTVTGFRLAGLHGTTPCASCHQDLRFSAMDVDPTACGSCHLDVHQGTLSADCTRCHTPEGFNVVSGIRIHQATDFILQGAHLQLSCESCHADDRGGAYAPIPSSCMACHREEFEAPKEVDHVTLGFPEDCMACHSPNAWQEVGAFSHASYSGGFDLQGAHAVLTCGRCHLPGGGLRFPTPSSPEDCYACHQADYMGEHGGSGYPTTCLTCHNTSDWDDADDDHAQLSGGYVLEGAHDGMACTGCHTPDGHGTLFSPAGPEDCLACHLADFQREHSGSGYPGTCLTCHAGTTWSGAEFNHDDAFFPINFGKHQGRWADCSTCHTVPGDYGVFTCLNCHEHERAQTDADHSEVRDYVYESGQCLSCHPTGND